jgi:arylsulfatase
MVYGVRQKPMDGQSLQPSLAACNAARPRTQYFELGGKMGLYHNGWFLSGDDGRAAWEAEGPGGKRPRIEWTLYDLTKDYSQATDVAAQNPAKLQEMLALGRAEAMRNNVYPLDYRRPMDRADRAAMISPRKRFDYWGKDVSVQGTGSAPYLAMRGFTLEADVVLGKAGASGAVVAWGSHFGGWSLYLDAGRPAFVYARSTDPKEMARVTASAALPQGASKITLRHQPAGLGQGAVVTISANGAEVARVTTPPGMLALAGGGESLDIGRDLGVTVTQYATPHGAIEGDVPHVVVTLD